MAPINTKAKIKKNYYSARSAAQHVEVTVGATWKTLPDTIIYEGTIPMTYVIPWSERKIDQSQGQYSQGFAQKTVRTCTAGRENTWRSLKRQ